MTIKQQLNTFLTP